MRKFLVQGPKYSAIIAYSDQGMLQNLDMSGVDRADAVAYFLAWVPKTIEFLEAYVNDTSRKLMKVTEIAPDLSFQAFWDAFDYKMGNRSRVEAAWAKMSTEDKNACMLSLKRYKTWKKLNPNIAHMYGETYLNQRRWENEYKIT